MFELTTCPLKTSTNVKVIHSLTKSQISVHMHNFHLYAYYSITILVVESCSQIRPLPFLRNLCQTISLACLLTALPSYRKNLFLLHLDKTPLQISTCRRVSEHNV